MTGLVVGPCWKQFLNGSARIGFMMDIGMNGIIDGIISRQEKIWSSIGQSIIGGNKKEPEGSFYLGATVIIISSVFGVESI